MKSGAPVPFVSRIAAFFFSLQLALFATAEVTSSQETSSWSDFLANEQREVINQSSEEVTIFQTESPLATMTTFAEHVYSLEQSFLRFEQERTREGQTEIQDGIAEISLLIDFPDDALVRNRQNRLATVSALMDIFGRVPWPASEAIPGVSEVIEKDIEYWRFPNTPVRLVKMQDGPREGEFLFSSHTDETAILFARRIEHLPLHSSLAFEAWDDFVPNIVGYWVPAFVQRNVPQVLNERWLDTPIWKVLLTSILVVLTLSALLILRKKLFLKRQHTRVSISFLRLMAPIVSLVLLSFVGYVHRDQIITSGRFYSIIDTSIELAKWLVFVWAFWLSVKAFFDYVISSPNVSKSGLDANLLRLSSKIVGIVGGTVILAYGGDQLGAPVLSLLAGLGVGGLAVALAVRPTFENLIGGFILYLDQPVKVGDFCSFGDRMGTIERIGVRSTQIRGRDRTLVSVPNALFADMELVNWAECDQMLIKEKLGLRYETDSDQLRFVLAKLTEMFVAHPKIDTDTVRVRFCGFGSSSLDIEVRVYALTRDWGEYFAIKEDVFLRAIDIVEDAGTGFAFPSRTLYLGRDHGLDEERSERATNTVESWRRDGKLPFPAPDVDRVTSLSGTLDYPPTGSSYAKPGSERPEKDQEPLSVDEEDKDSKL